MLYVEEISSLCHDPSHGVPSILRLQGTNGTSSVGLGTIFGLEAIFDEYMQSVTLLKDTHLYKRHL